MIYILYISTFLNFVLSVVVLAYKSTKVSIYFSGFLATASLWSFSNALFIESKDEKIMTFWAYAAYTAATIMLFFLYLFSNTVSKYKNKKTIIFISYIISVFSLILPYIPKFIFLGVDFEEKKIIGTKFLPILFLTYIYLVYLSLRNLFIGIRINTGTKRIQLQFILFGLSIAVLTGVTTNIILPFFNNYSLVTVGPSFSIMFFVFVALSIFKYEFLNIRIVMGELIKNSLLIFMLIISYYIALFINIFLFGTYITFPGFVLGIILATLVLFLLKKSEIGLNSFITRKITSPRYTLNTQIKELNKKLATTFTYEEIAKAIFQELDSTVLPEYKNILMMKGDKITNLFGDSFNVKKYELIRVLKEIINLKISFFIADKVQIELQTFPKTLIKRYAKVLEKINKLNLEVIVTLKKTENNYIFLILGEKLSGENYTAIDINFLEILKDTIALALERALLYQEVQNFNITLQKKIEEATSELKQKNTELAEALRKERDMLDILGHELRTPLGIARNALFMLKVIAGKYKITDEKFNQYVQIANDNINREIKILETILSSARIENDRLDLTFEQVDIKEIALSTFETYKPQAEKKGLKILTKLPKNNVSVYGDKVGIQQILDNLVSNAVKYTEEGSVEIFVKTKGDEVLFGTKDTGEGIPKHEIKNLGKKFYRINPYLDSSGKIGNRQIVRPGGTGIGLYVVFSLIRNMKGKINVESELGKGSTFTVSLPKYSGQRVKQIKKSDVSKLFEKKLAEKNKATSKTKKD